MTLTWTDLFAEVSAIASASQDPDREAEGRELLIRLLGKHDNDDFGELVPLINALCTRFGLHPYRLDTEPASESEALAVALHEAPAGSPDTPFLFSKQLEVYQRLIAGESLILSAPTSFGKSALLDQLLASGKWDQVVIIVPTIALIDETRRRLARFRDQYSIVTHAAEHQEVTGSKAIYVLTQERYLDLPDVPVDFFVIDEFYKLSPTRTQDSRQTLLNITWRRLLATGAQYYLTGPNISSLSEHLEEDLRSKLLVTDFRTVAVDYSDWSDVIASDRQEHLRQHRPELVDPLLVFVSSKDRAENVGLALPSVAAAQPTSPGPTASEVADWLASHFDPDWSVVKALRQGTGIHHGSLPRSVQRIMVRLFNEGRVPTLVCTTTLIEGVNTVARTVVIFDHTIDRRNIDSFTFGNISGRAGRAFRHFVGDVYSYMALPTGTQMVVDIPIESQTAEAPLSALVQLSEVEWSDETAARMEGVLQQSDLSLEVIRANRGVDPELQVALAQELRGRSSARNSVFAWTGMPTTGALKATLKLGFNSLVESSAKRGMNADMLAGKLQALMHNPADFTARVNEQMQYKRAGQTRSDVVNDVLSFERDWVQFRIPSMLRSLQAIQSEVLRDLGMNAGNYDFFLRNVESGFLDGGIVDLDEYGVPTPLSLRLLAGRGTARDTVVDRLGQLREVFLARGARLPPVEQWIVDDALEGYFGPEWRSATT